MTTLSLTLSLCLFIIPYQLVSQSVTQSASAAFVFFSQSAYLETLASVSFFSTLVTHSVSLYSIGSQFFTLSVSLPLSQLAIPFQ